MSVDFVAGLGLGVVLGWIVGYFVLGLPVQKMNHELTRQIVGMRKMGFLPTYESDYEPERSPEVPEY